jgi:hypothetical protein
MELLELALLAIASAFWPVLVVVDLVALRAPRPVPLLAWFLAGGLLTTISEGLVIVFVLEGTTAGSSRSSVGGWGNVIGGCVALLAAYVLRARAARSRGERPAVQAPPVKKASRTERMIEHGGLYAFAAGVVLNVFPGIFPLIALRNISSLSYGNGAKVLLIIGLYLVTFVLIEVPLGGLLVAPARVEPMVRGLNQWLDRNGKRVAIDVLGIVGLFLVVRGVVQLVAT